MWELVSIVVPMVKAEWKDLALAMTYKLYEVKAFKKDGQDVDDHCKELFENWLTTGHDPKPKTYKTLLQYIKKVNNLAGVYDDIEKKLIKGS